MATAVIMPKQGQSVETCIITKWFKNKGEKVSVGDILFSYETDKAAFDLESPVEGVLLDMFFADGAEVPVLVNVAVIGKSGEETLSFDPNQTKTKSKVEVEVKVEKKVEAVVESLMPETSGKIRISPRAKKLAEDKKFNYNNLQGSGPNGRIITADIENALSGAAVVTKTFHTTGAEFTEAPLSNVRKLIAKAMHASLQNSAQLTHHMSADVFTFWKQDKKLKVKYHQGNRLRILL